MKIGKIDEADFRALIQGRFGRRDPSVLVPPRTGVDAAVIDIGGGRALVVAEDPIFTMPRLPLETFGRFTVHIGASDVAVMGVAPRYMTYTLLLPPETERAEVGRIVESIHVAARGLGIAIVGGHTGFYPGFSAPTIGGIAVFGLARKRDIVTPAGARPGDAVVLTKGPAIETAALLACLREEELLARHPASLVAKAKALTRSITVVADALTAAASGGVTAMHDATEGGVAGGLYEIASASGVGMEADERLFVYPDEVRMVCEAFAIDPVKAIAEGSLLVTVRPRRVAALLARLKRKRIAASVIGRVVADKRRRTIVRRDGRTEPLAIPEQDPFWPAFFDGLGKA
ncbi:MAG: AIR synthase family protein [Acidobacteria bacterium]|jgi:hydrogenase maturation factor|nr:AIR synthase family protein [Acidobacteriota bacterium]